MSNESFDVRWGFVKELTEIMLYLSSISTTVGCFHGKKVETREVNSVRFIENGPKFEMNVSFHTMSRRDLNVTKLKWSYSSKAF